MKVLLRGVAFALATAGVFAKLTTDSVEITGSFPKENQFGIVYNGEPNKLLLKIANLGRDALDVVNIKSVESEFREIGGKERVVRKNKATPFKGSIPPGEPVTLPYTFSSELKEGNFNLRVWVDWTSSQGLKEKTLAYDSTVTISEPPTRWFDPQLILLYLILVGGSGFGTLLLYNSFVAPSNKKSGRKPGLVKLPSGIDDMSLNEKIKTPGGGAYEEDWIPKGHINNNNKAVVGQSKVGSGIESGGDTSGTEGKVRRRKR